MHASGEDSTECGERVLHESRKSLLRPTDFQTARQLYAIAWLFSRQWSLVFYTAFKMIENKNHHPIRCPVHASLSTSYVYCATRWLRLMTTSVRFYSRNTEHFHTLATECFAQIWNYKLKILKTLPYYIFLIFGFVPCFKTLTILMNS